MARPPRGRGRCGAPGRGRAGARRRRGRRLRDPTPGRGRRGRRGPPRPPSAGRRPARCPSRRGGRDRPTRAARRSGRRRPSSRARRAAPQGRLQVVEAQDGDGEAADGGAATRDGDGCGPRAVDRADDGHGAAGAPEHRDRPARPGCAAVARQPDGLHPPLVGAEVGARRPGDGRVGPGRRVGDRRPVGGVGAGVDDRVERRAAVEDAPRRHRERGRLDAPGRGEERGDVPHLVDVADHGRVEHRGHELQAPALVVARVAPSVPRDQRRRGDPHQQHRDDRARLQDGTASHREPPRQPGASSPSPQRVNRPPRTAVSTRPGGAARRRSWAARGRPRRRATTRAAWRRPCGTPS